MAISTEISSIKDQRTTTRSSRNTTRRGMAFLIEALVTLAFLMGCLAVFIQLFSSAQLEGIAANKLSRAVVAATNRAEEFSARPWDVSGTTTEGGLSVECSVVDDVREAGTLYNATITVYDNGNEIYRLNTSRYVSGDTGGEAE